jgi:hypothetical protein
MLVLRGPYRFYNGREVPSHLVCKFVAYGKTPTDADRNLKDGNSLAEHVAMGDLFHKKV